MFLSKITASPTFREIPSRRISPGRDSSITGRVMLCSTDARACRNLTALLQELDHDVEQYESYDATVYATTASASELVILDDQRADQENVAFRTPLNDLDSCQIPLMGLVAEHRRLFPAQAAMHDVDICVQKLVNGPQFQSCVQPLLRAKRQNDRAIAQLVHAVEAKDAYTQGHLYRISLYASTIGKLLQLPRPEMIALHYGALLHDIGKLYIDEAIIRKEGPLTDDEYRKMQRHSIFGEQIVREHCTIRGVAPIVRHHHERWDGGGYPDGLAKTAIPLGARIVAVADAFDAMTTQRPYNQVISFDEAMAYLCAGVGRYWDAQIVAVFVEWLQSCHERFNNRNLQYHSFQGS